MAQAKPAGAEPAGEKVQVYLYDLSQGAAAMLSHGLLGKKIDGIWHTGLVVYGYEYYYGGGIQYAKPGQTMAGRPMRIIDIGETHIGQDMFHEFLQSISPRFSPATYSLLKHNCNNFSNECAQFLTGKPIPEYITGLPEEALNTPMGQMFKPMIEQMESQMRNSHGAGFVPWSEGGALSLPPVRKGGAGAANAAALAGVPAVAAGAAAAVGGAAAAAAAPKPADAKAAAAAAAGPAGSPGAPSPAAVSGANAAKHPHYGLGCTCVSTQSRAQLAAAESHCATFLALIKQANKKVPAAAQLSEEQLKALADAAAALGPAQGDAKDAKAPAAGAGAGAGAGDKEKPATAISAAAMGAFDVMLLNWGSKQLFGTLGLFRLAVLRPEVAAYYADKCYPPLPAPKVADGKAAAAGNAAPATAGHVLAKVLAILPKATDKKDAAAADAPAAAVQIMALCTASNLFSAAALCPKLAADPSVISTALHTARAASEKTIRVAAATLLYNCALFVPKTSDGDSAIELVSALAEMVQNEREPEPSALLLLALAHLVFGNSSLAVILHAMDVDFGAVRSRFAGSAQGVSGARIAALTADLQKIVAYEKHQQS